MAGSVGYLAVVAAQSIAALGALCQGAPVAAGPSLSGTLLKHNDITTRDRNLSRQSHTVHHSDASDTHHRAATVALLSRLHKAISTHRRVQQLPERNSVGSFKTCRDTVVSVCLGGMYLHRFVKETGSSTTVQEVMELLHVAVRELLGQVVTVNARARSDKSRRKDAGGAGEEHIKCNSFNFSLQCQRTA